MAFGRIFQFLAAALFALAATPAALAQFSLQGPGVVPGDFRVTTFATGLNFPVGMTDLPDGSLLVAVSNGDVAFSSSTSGSLIRLVDTDLDGVADVQQTLVNNVPGGRRTSVRRAGNVIAVTGQGTTDPISFYRLGANASDPLTSLGQLSFTYPAGGWSHQHTSLFLRQTPGQSGQYELFFQIGSKTNNAQTTQTVGLGGTLGLSATLNGDAIHRVRITDNGTTLTATQHTQIASGLRNASGFAFHPTTGDLYIGENGIDGISGDINEPHSVDELNMIPANQLGSSVPDFGFPNNYEQYRTGTQVGSSGVLPLVTFQPIPMPNGSEAEGVNEIVFAPPSFPAALRDGLFAGFHGRFTAGGVANEENPVVFVDVDTGDYFHIVGNHEPGVGHPNGFVSTNDTLYISDMSPTGGLAAGQANTGRIYAIQALTPPGDYNNNDVVDAADYVLWRKHDNTAVTLPNDATLGTAPVDYDVWRANFNREADSAAAGDIAATPEPSSLMLAVLALPGCHRRRFRR